MGNVTAEQVQIRVFRGSPDVLDPDGNGNCDALTDGLLELRYLFGFRGDSLVSGALAPDALRTTAELVKPPIESVLDQLDVDDDGTNDALTDGLLIVRYLFGFRGEALVLGAVSTGCNRSEAADVEAYLSDLEGI